MTVQQIATMPTFTIRFTCHGKELTIDASHSPAESAIFLNLYDGANLIHSDVMPVTSDLLGLNLQANLEESARSIKVQIDEVYALLDDVETHTDVESHLLLGQCFESLGLYDEALSVYESAESIAPGDDRRIFRQGFCLLEVGKFKLAQKHLKLAVEQKPLYADYRNLYGLSSLWCENVTEAVRQFDQALELNPYYADALYCKGLAYLYNGVKKIDKEMLRDFEPRTIRHIEKCAMIDESYHTHELEIGVSLIKNGRYKDAFAALRRNRDFVLKSRRPDFEVINSKLDEKLHGADRESVQKRIDLLSEQLEKNPDYADRVFQLGLSYFRLAENDWKMGLDKLKRVLEINPSLAKGREGQDTGRSLYQKLSKAISEIESYD